MLLEMVEVLYKSNMSMGTIVQQQISIKLHFRDARTQSVNVTFRFIHLNTKILNFRGELHFRHYFEVYESAD